MRRIHWVLLAAFAVAAVAVSSLWMDVRGFFSNSQAGPAPEITPASRSTPPGRPEEPPGLYGPTETSYRVANPPDGPVLPASAYSEIPAEDPREAPPHARPAVFTETGAPLPPQLAPSQVTLPRLESGPPQPIELLPEPYVEGESPLDDVSIRPNTNFLGPATDDGQPLDPNSTEAVLSEILEQTGSAISKSSIFGDDDAAIKRHLREVQKELRRLQQQDAAMQQETPGPQHYPAAGPYELPGGNHRKTLSKADVETLRDAARQLEFIGDQLERHDLFERADQIRGMAQSLRVDARQGK